MSAERTHLFTAHRSGLRFALIIGLALSPACKRVALDLDNLSCDGGTCVDGYVCNPTTNMCEKEGSNTCVSETEIPCNGVDEDCDGSDLQESGTTTNCSACGDDCTTAFEVAAAICNTTTGTNICEITLCNPGFLDVDRVAGTGCEGTCRQSNGGVETCDGVDNDCNGSIDDITGAAADADCNAKITGANVGTWTCMAGRCEVSSCATDFHDVDGFATNGCEYNCTDTGAETCDGIDNDCNKIIDDVADATADCNTRLSNPPDVVELSCTAGVCVITGCAAGTVDTNTTASDGCEGTCTAAGAEACDGTDTDCDGFIDNAPPGSTGCSDFYVDADGDLFGETGSGVCLCRANSTNSAAMDGDCDDTSAACTANCDDNDSDSIFDCKDFCVDVDGDGVGDGAFAKLACDTQSSDSNDDDSSACTDDDGDNCDDCSVTRWDPFFDGADADSDGICDAGDTCTDVDGDGLGNGTLSNVGCGNSTTDTDDSDPNTCGDTDFDTCEDCLSGTWDPAADGPDDDSDGTCNAGEGLCVDTDGDGLGDGSNGNAGCEHSDTDSTLDNAYLCADTDNDTCDDCSVEGFFNPANDGTDTDADTICDASDVCPGFDDRLDNDGDGIPDGCDPCPGNEAPGDDCGVCMTCNGSGACNENLAEDADCGFCEECASGGGCRNQSSGDDVKVECADADFCNGTETCDGSGACQAESNPCPGTECNNCDEANDSCFDPAGTSCTDDSLFCNGVETCDGSGSCVSVGNPCPGTDCNTCNENADSCFTTAATACSSDGQFCTGPEECDGSGSCVSTGDPCSGTECKTCNETANNCFTAAGTSCTDDGLFCTGSEECDGAGTCDGTGDPCPGTECNSCDEAGDDCTDPAGTACTDDGFYCTGPEECDGSGSCGSTGDPCLSPAICDEPGDNCVGCQNDGDCPLCQICNGSQVCVPAGEGTDPRNQCGVPVCETDSCDGSSACALEAAGTSCTNDGLFCTGPEECDVAGVCGSTGNPCSGAECNTCNEAADNCFTSATTPCANDGFFCTGVEECDGGGNCVGSGDPCPGTECKTCDEAANNCFTAAGTGCTDDNLFCTGAETCDGTGNCDNSGDPCPGTECKTCNETDDNCFDPSGTTCTDDGVYCTGPEQCDGSGSCNSTGNSCSGAECNTCNEAADNCIDPYGTACTDDGVACTDDICSAGACNPANEGACGGGEICNACMYSGTGCGALPTSLALSCDTSAVVGNPASCTITLDGFQCEGANIICVPDIVPTTLFSDNGNTDPDANPDWTTISGDPTIESGWLVADDVDWTVETSIDTSGMDVVCIEFDWRIINENAGEYILVEFSTNGGSTYQEAVRIDFRPDSEPESWKREELLLAWFGNACLTDIDALAANNTDLRVRLRLVSNAGNDKVYVDNFNVIGFPVTTSTVLLDDPFDNFDNWTTLSGTPQLTTELPGGNSAAVADKDLAGPNSWSAFTSVDASSCDVVDLDFDIAFDRADGGETIAVAMSTDGGSGWTDVMSIDFNVLDTDNLRRTWNQLMRLTDLDPAAAGKGDLRVSITLSSNSNGREVYLDNLQIICYDLPDPATLFTANSYTDNGDGSYGFTVDATSPGTAELTCTWDNGDDPALADTVTTDFTP